MSPLQASESIYYGNPFIEVLGVARYIREHTVADTRIAVFGSEPEIYFYAGRHSATGYIYTYPLMEPQPNALRMQWEMIHQVEFTKPDYLVLVTCDLSWLARPSSDLTVFKLFK